MKTTIVWLLIAISFGQSNRGTVTVIEEYAFKNNCVESAKAITNRYFRLECIEIVKEIK